MNSIDSERLEKSRCEFAALGTNATGVVVDIDNRMGCEAIIEAALNDFIGVTGRSIALAR